MLWRCVQQTGHHGHHHHSHQHGTGAMGTGTGTGGTSGGVVGQVKSMIPGTTVRIVVWLISRLCHCHVCCLHAVHATG